MSAGCVRACTGHCGDKGSRKQGPNPIRDESGMSKITVENTSWQAQESWCVCVCGCVGVWVCVRAHVLTHRAVGGMQIRAKINGW